MVILGGGGVSYELGTPVCHETGCLPLTLSLTSAAASSLKFTSTSAALMYASGCSIRLLMSLQHDEYSTHNRCRANMAHIRQSRPDSGLGFNVKVLGTLQFFPFSLGSGSLSLPVLADGVVAVDLKAVN